MKYIVLFFIAFFISPFVIAQENSDNAKVIDSLYREDQFYFGITYNLLNNKPVGVSQNGFSSGFHFGVIRDMPINSKRNKAIGVGLGMSINSYNQNLLIAELANKDIVYAILNDDQTVFSKNKFYTYVLELPVEYRWRTSIASEYNFWRIYTGFKVGYVFANATKFLGQPDDIQLKTTDAFNKIQYGLTLSAGYNTWNFHIYYGLNSLFDNAQILGQTQTLNTSTIKAGLMFYIL